MEGLYNLSMNLAEIKKERGPDLRRATWCFLLKDDDTLLLAMKKRGFGEGFWNASGGKVLDGEDPVEAAAREVCEELNVVVSDLVHVATIEFYFKNKPEFGQRVFGYIAKKWKGEPEETNEMAPAWFRYDEIPYDQMWADDRIWLPMVLDGKKVEGEFLFGDTNDIIEYNIRVIS